MADGDLRHDLGELVRELLAERTGCGEPVAPLLRAHLGERAHEVPILAEELDAWELPNLQLAIEAALARPGWSARTVGLMGQAKRYSATSLSDFLSDADWVPDVGPPEYVNANVGPDRTLPCLDFALLLIASPGGPLALFVRRST